MSTSAARLCQVNENSPSTIYIGIFFSCAILYGIIAGAIVVFFLPLIVVICWLISPPSSQSIVAIQRSHKCIKTSITANPCAADDNDILFVKSSTIKELRLPKTPTRRSVQFDLDRNQTWEIAVERSPSVCSAASDISYNSDDDWAMNPLCLSPMKLAM
uniref:Uncharacterized protein n=1 Tax=Spongospora subterranea TaxID=70186 RepID=A0A0H5RA89_9EUKA|eukprot:CRZ10998.1 hypothetical protein [Spongospora subterranea]